MVLSQAFHPRPGYLNTATMGLPPASTVDVLHRLADDWRDGRLLATDFDQDVSRARTAWAAICGVPPEWVSIASTASELVGLVAASLPDGARVVIAEEEFTSLLFPFLAHADRGVVVDELPLEQLAGFTGPADLVAVSAVQSSDGRVADVAGLAVAARSAGARLLVDTTQSCGWLPLDCSTIDFVVCSAYKWLLCPRGVAFLSAQPASAATLRPLSAGWYAGQDPWESIYGSPLRLAADARRFDISPAWFSWAGAAPALELIAGLDRAAVREHNVTLADTFLEALRLPPQSSAIVTIDVPGAAEALGAAGVRVAVRAGRVRVSFHLYNDQTDVDLAVDSLRARL